MMRLKSALFLVPMVAILAVNQVHAEVYVEGHGGVQFGCSKITCLQACNPYGSQGVVALFDVPTKSITPSIVGGVCLGAWFNQGCCACGCKEGVLEHCGGYVDLTVSRAKYCHCLPSSTINYFVPALSQEVPQGVGAADINLLGKGPLATLAFMFALRGTYCKTEQYLAGRVQPYIAVGPAITWVRQCARLTVGPHMVAPHFSVVLRNLYTIAPTCKSSRHVACFAFDAGVRSMFCDNFFIDGLFTYRYAPARFSFDLMSLEHHFNLFSLQLGLGYNF